MKDDGQGGEVDIANTPYADLPPKWQAENKASAESAVRAILDNPDADMEQLASIVHDAWLERNGSWAPPEQNVPYEQLSETEKQKDRDVVEAARRAIQGTATEERAELVYDRAEAQRRAEEIMAAGAAAEPELTALITSIAEGAGGSMTGLEHRLKTVESLARKLHDKAKAKGISIEDYAARVADAVRYTAIVDDDPPGNYAAAIRRTIEMLEAQGIQVEELETHWLPGDSYNGVHLVGRHPNGTLFELQFHTTGSIEAKNSTHGIYERIRQAGVAPEERREGLLRMARIADQTPMPLDALSLGVQVVRPTE